jgi:hypothetical protein
MYLYRSTLTFFGLTPQYRESLFNQIHDLVFHGGGGFKHSEVYNMPIWMRMFHIHKINEHNKKVQADYDRANNRSNIGDDNKDVMGPNISPSSTFNFNK